MNNLLVSDDEDEDSKHESSIEHENLPEDDPRKLRALFEE